MTRFSFEVPLAHLSDFKEYQDFLFVLSFLFEDKEYAKHYEMFEGEKWIDNSFNELRRPNESEALADLYKTVGADKIVAPDSLDWELGRSLQEALAMVEYGVPIDKVVVVVKSPDWIDYFKTYGFSSFAVSYHRRYCPAYKLRRFKECHFLGLVSVAELKIAQPPSCDTSMPIKLALQNLTLQDWIQQGCPHIHTYPDFFKVKMSPEQVKLAMQNIQALKQVVTQEDVVNYPKHYTQGKIEVIDFISDQKLPFLAANIVKYICRYRYKGGVTDLRKAEFYLRRLIEEEELND